MTTILNSLISCKHNTTVLKSKFSCKEANRIIIKTQWDWVYQRRMTWEIFIIVIVVITGWVRRFDLICFSMLSLEQYSLVILLLLLLLFLLVWFNRLIIGVDISILKAHNLKNKDLYCRSLGTVIAMIIIMQAQGWTQNRVIIFMEMASKILNSYTGRYYNKIARTSSRRRTSNSKVIWRLIGSRWIIIKIKIWVLALITMILDHSTLELQVLRRLRQWMSPEY